MQKENKTGELVLQTNAEIVNKLFKEGRISEDEAGQLLIVAETIA